MRPLAALRKVAAEAGAPVVEALAAGELEVHPQAVHRRGERLAAQRPEREALGFTKCRLSWRRHRRGEWGTQWPGQRGWTEQFSH
jgi:hypothetical protein